jgi:hypothetical protein
MVSNSVAVLPTGTTRKFFDGYTFVALFSLVSFLLFIEYKVSPYSDLTRFRTTKLKSLQDII